MKSSISKVFALALGLTLAVGGALAQPPGPHGDFLDGHRLGFFADYLDLTDAQQAQIKQIASNAKPAMEPLHQQEHQSREQMRQLIQGGTFDQAKAQAIANQEAQVHAQIEVQRASVEFQTYQVLTPEQKTKLSQFMARREQRLKQHMQQEPATNQ
jgi:protein CpxP